MSFDIYTGVLTADLATSGTLVVAYLPGKSKGNYSLSGDHRIVFGGNDGYASPKDFTVSFGANASGATITWRASNTIKSGRRFTIQFEHQGENDGRPNDPANIAKMADSRLWMIDLGSPNAADPDGVSTTQAVTVATTPLAVINGALASGGVATFDVPRNVVAAWTGTAVLTLTGTDEYGEVLVESSASGTSLAGKKAFKTVTSASFSADVTAATIGTGDVLGLPVFLPATALVLLTLEDATSQAGTLVAGSTVVPSATSADVRGTIDPNAAMNGNVGIKLFVALVDPAYKGGAQYAG